MLDLSSNEESWTSLLARLLIIPSAAVASWSVHWRRRIMASYISGLGYCSRHEKLK